LTGERAGTASAREQNHFEAALRRLRCSHAAIMPSPPRRPGEPLTGRVPRTLEEFPVCANAWYSLSLPCVGASSYGP
jgi:hypothetical protein